MSDQQAGPAPKAPIKIAGSIPATNKPHARYWAESGCEPQNQHRASSDAARCANTLCGKYRMTNIEAAAWIGHAARKEGLGGDNDLLRRNWVSQATGHAISRYQVRPASMLVMMLSSGARPRW